ncbi:hypothetical protein [Hydrogenophaga taeniospiralis]|uniref:hypothetical protein n=1 Tax=Hydrogenophaga taeniospiralis TaxID=65656 RepID=UPI001CF98E13|nr:hypothetical protein [Hydrogenophaga taeniospiralis]UCU93801.1 hypothetical protein KI616_24125 [Hydrogenophaga taeniospiralis]
MAIEFNPPLSAGIHRDPESRRRRNARGAQASTRLNLQEAALGGSAAEPLSEKNANMLPTRGWWASICDPPWQGVVRKRKPCKKRIWQRSLMHKFCATGPQRTPEKKPRSKGGASGVHPRRPLISLASGACFFSVQFKQALDLKGLPACAQTLSTKLSTEILDSGKSQSKSKTYTAFPQFNRRKRPRITI